MWLFGTWIILFQDDGHEYSPRNVAVDRHGEPKSTALPSPRSGPSNLQDLSPIRRCTQRRDRSGLPLAIPIATREIVLEMNPNGSDLFTVLIGAPLGPQLVQEIIVW